MKRKYNAYTLSRVQIATELQLSPLMVKFLLKDGRLKSKHVRDVALFIDEEL